MPERNEPHSESSSASTVVDATVTGASEALAGAVGALPAPGSRAEDEARERIATLEREAKALGADPAAALLFHEIGLLFEEPLKNPRSAAVAYQNAYKIAPRFLSNLRAARRLFADVGNWQMVIQLLDAELAAVEEPRERAALLFEKALCLQRRLSRDEEAAKIYQAVLDAKPTDIALLQQLEGVYLEREEDAPRVQVYLLLAESLQDEVLSSRYLTAAASVLEDRLGKPDEAAGLFREAFATDRHDPLLLSAILRLAEREDVPEEELQALAAEAELLGPQAAPTYLRISKVYARLGRPEDALAALLAARRVAPTEALVLSELAAIYEAHGRHEELADVLSSWVSALADEEAVALNLRLAALYEDELRRDEDAISRYQAVLTRVPGHVAALAGLGKLYHRAGNWQGLISVYEIEVAGAEDPKQKAAKLYKAAEIEERMGRLEAAISRYNLCLQLQPGYLPAQQALSRVYEKHGRFADLIAMHEQDLLQAQSPDQTFATLSTIASIYEQRLNDLDRAIETVKRMLELDAAHLPSLRNLARLYERGSRWAELIQTHEEEAARVSDTKQVLALLHGNAEILEDRLKDRGGATATYERILALSPSYLPALKALGRLYAQDGRWDELIRMYRAEAEIAAAPEHAAPLIYKVGELHERKLKQADEALAAYQEVLSLQPAYFPAQRALARIYRAAGSWEALVEVLRAEAAGRTDPQERANALFQAAAIWEERLAKPKEAIAGYEEVLRLSPSHASAARALERLYAATGNVKELIAVLDREAQTSASPAARVSAYLKLLRLYLDKVNEPSRAVQCCEAILALDPESYAALKALERLRMSDRPRLAEVRSRLAEQVNEPRLRSALRLAACTEVDPTGPLAAAALAEAVADGTPPDSRLTFALERALRAKQDVKGLVALFERQLQAATDPMERLELTLRTADLYESRLADFNRARQLYRAALEQNPSLLPALQGASRVSLKLKDWAGARAALEMEGRSCRDVQSALKAFTAAGRLCAEQLADADGAIANFRRALERDPLDPAASAGLEQLLASRGGAADLAILHERRGDAKLAQKDLSAAAAELYEAARMWLSSVKDPVRALAAVDRTLAAQPGHLEALQLKAELAIAAGQFQEAATALSLRVQQGGDAKALSAIHLKLGWLYQTQLADVTRAAAHLQTALASDPGSTEALERLSEIHTQSRNWTGAADCLKRLLELETGPEAQGRHTVALAHVFDLGFSDTTQAVALYRQALDLMPGDGFVVDRLADLYERTKNLPELVQVLEQQAQQSSDAQRAVGLRLKIGSLYAKGLSDPARAVATFRSVVEQDPKNVEAHAALAELYMRDAAAAPMAIDEHRSLLRLDPTRLESLHALFRLWEGLRQTDKAFAAACALQFFRAANEAETVFYTEHKARIPNEVQLRLPDAELELLMHPWTHGGLVEVLKAIGDHLTKLYPPDFDGLGVDKKADRLKPDHVVHKAIRAVAQVFGVEAFEVFHARRGLMTLETTEPLSVCVGQEVVRKFNAREQKFLIGRAVHGLLSKTPLLSKLVPRDRAKVLGSAVRLGNPAFRGISDADPVQEKALRKALPRKALKLLEQLAPSVHPDVDVEHATAGLFLSADRAGLLMSGDVLMGLNMLLRQDPGYTTAMRGESTEVVMLSTRQREDVRELLAFSLSEDFFRLRQKAGLAIVG